MKDLVPNASGFRICIKRKDAELVSFKIKNLEFTSSIRLKLKVYVYKYKSYNKKLHNRITKANKSKAIYIYN